MKLEPGEGAREKRDRKGARKRIQRREIASHERNTDMPEEWRPRRRYVTNASL